MKKIQVSNVSKSFGTTKILNAVSLEIPSNHITGLFGRNGTGKSTLLKIIYGTLGADSINMFVDGTLTIPKNVIQQQNIGYLPQQSFLPKELQVRKVIPMFYSNGDDQDKIFYTQGVSSFEKQLIGKLSIGQLRYLELLLVGNLDHNYLILDEPFSMIEPLYKDIIKTYLTGLKQYKGIILTDHYYNDVLEITDSNYVLTDGSLNQINSKHDLLTYKYLNSLD